MRTAAVFAMVTAFVAGANADKSVAESALLCEACNLATDAAESFVAANSTETKIENFLVNTVCPVLGSEAGACEMFAPVIVPEALKLAETKLPTLCVDTGVCDSEISAVTMYEARLTLANGENSDAGCSLCKLIAGWLEGILAQNTTVTKIENALEKLCDDLPGSLSDTCTEYVEAYGGMLVQLIEQSVPPEKACELVTLCPKPETTSLAKLGDECSTCEFALQTVKTYLGDNTTVTEIVNKVLDLCKTYAGSYADQCTEYVTAYGAEALMMLANYIDPATDCTKLGLCTNSSAVYQVPHFASHKVIQMPSAVAAQ